VAITCSGKGCQTASIGKLNEVREVPRWRIPDDWQDNVRAYEILTTVHYCAEHEQIAKETHQRVRSGQPVSG
jgi:hypothetical protein